MRYMIYGKVSKTACQKRSYWPCPTVTQLLINIPAEDLFYIGDKIGVALEKIKEERPEEYEKAYNNRMVILRDKQWKEIIKQQNENRKK